MFQQLLVHKHYRLRDSKSHDLAEWRSASRHRHKLRHLNSGREKFGSADRHDKKKKRISFRSYNRACKIKFIFSTFFVSRHAKRGHRKIFQIFLKPGTSADRYNASLF